MAITQELEAKILRYYHVEQWRIGTIARQLGVHHGTVARVLSASGVPKIKSMFKSKLDPFAPFILETLSKYPQLTAQRIYEMARTRGYRGGVSHFRNFVALHRPRPPTEAYLRLRTLPGEQAQVDWGHFGHIMFERAKRPLMAFVMVLSFSRKIFLRFYLNARIENFLHGHEAAFNYFNGVARVVLVDNLKSAVLERCGDTIRFNPTLLEFASHYKYEPRPVAVARGNEKGRVERAIRYIRDNFFAARQWHDIDDLNAQALVWCDGIASDRPCPEEPIQTVGAAFMQEQSLLMPLPANPYPTYERCEVMVGKTPYVRFDLNDYSVPHNYVRRMLIVQATIDEVSILVGTDIIATHKRIYGKGVQVEDELHIQALAAQKHQAKQHRGQNRLLHAVPVAADLLKIAVEHNLHMGHVTMRLLQLLDDYGVVEITAAVKEAVKRQAPHPNSVHHILEQRREQRSQLPLVKLDLPNDKRVRELVVQPHKLSNYDELTTNTTNGVTNDRK